MLRLLGPLELVSDRVSIGLGGPRRRVVLAMLGLNPNRVVSLEQLIDAVWGVAPPSTARGQVQTCISGLRRVLAEAGYPDAIATRPPGYVLQISEEGLDTLVFASLTTRAKTCGAEGRTEQAAQLLREAITLWRGVALADVTSDLVQRGATVLEESRMAAIEELARLELALGRHNLVSGELRTLVAEHPLRENLYHLLMLALYRSGRQAEALEVARRARTVLREEIGVEPGSELQNLAQAILNREPSLNPGPPERTGDPPPGDQPPIGSSAPVALPEHRLPVPQQLPASIADFTGRESVLEEVRGRLERRDADSFCWSMPIVAISGKGGVGKSSLAVRVAHELTPAFPDGQLYAGLRTPTGTNSPARLLARFLRALGVSGSALPESLEERQELFRTRLSGRRVLLLLDDATDEADVLPLLPGAPSCAVLVTSRKRLSGLPGAHRVDVGVLEADRSLDLLGKIVGTDRVAAEHPAALELVTFCCGLPLALRIAGARLASRPHWRIDNLVRRLRDEASRLDELSHQGLELRSNIELTYRGLDDSARRLFRLSSLVQASDFPDWTAAALLDTSLGEGREVLESLVDAQLLDVVIHPGPHPVRYRFHELIRLYAMEQVLTEESKNERRAALTRMLGAWLAHAEAAHRKEYGGDFTILHGDAPRWSPGQAEIAECVADAAAWWEAERRALVEGVRQAAEAGLHELCWDLALTSVTLFEAKGYFDDWHECAQIALEATERAGNTTGMAAMRYSLGTLHMFQTRLEDAERCFTSALEIFSTEGNAHGSALVLRNAAHIDALRHDIPAMLDKYATALRTMREVGDRIGEAHILRSLARHRMEEQNDREARELLEEALQICREVGCLRAEAQVVHSFAELQLGAGQLDQARRSLHRVLRIVRDAGDRIGEAYAVYGLSVLRQRECRLDAAETTLAHALDLARQVGERFIEAKSLYGLGEIALARDTVSAGAAYLEAANSLFAGLGASVWQARTLILLTEIRATDAPEQARTHLEQVDRLLSAVDSRESAHLLEEVRGMRIGAFAAGIPGSSADMGARAAIEAGGSAST
ncbi:SARP family transcriptional regulator [Streptomyces alkaliphilus]|uniref:SARP family transcriptional regulator n=1 Tax=Streptomyces alkaliphilus TaxID=1472722 RepID=A0A7W3T9N3_9ACTN|nr:BTAD domain-containing putative transcriptional regulator [Streptomyces alkaliphilus]MBB0242791.1 SARP family transcriptional regulator [Streptomyces alkaliphilus]